MRNRIEEIRTLGDTPIEPRFRDVMNKVARAIDKMFNGDLRGDDRKTGFVLLVFPFDGEDQCNYISNGDRQDVIVMMKEQIKRFEGQPEMEGHA
jgi:hypothetical protein